MYFSAIIMKQPQNGAAYPEHNIEHDTHVKRQQKNNLTHAARHHIYVAPHRTLLTIHHRSVIKPIVIRHFYLFWNCVVVAALFISLRFRSPTKRSLHKLKSCRKHYLFAFWPPSPQPHSGFRATSHKSIIHRSQHKMPPSSAKSPSSLNSHWSVRIQRLRNCHCSPKSMAVSRQSFVFHLTNSR